MTENTSGFDSQYARELVPLNKTDLLRAETSNSLLEDAYGYIRKSPEIAVGVGAGIVLGAVGIAALCRRMTASGRAIEAGVQAKAASSESVFRAGSGNLRTLEGKSIPDLERPFLLDGAAAQEALISARTEAYAGDLVRFWSLPSKLAADTGETLAGFSQRTFSMRSAITAERQTGESFAKEAERLSKLNDGIHLSSDLTGKTLTVFDQASIVKFAEDLQFKHVPQIGQFLKGTGRISEQQIDQALLIQKQLSDSGTKKLIGEILVERKLAQQADVDLAFSRQQELKAVLKAVREKFFVSVESVSK